MQTLDIDSTVERPPGFSGSHRRRLFDLCYRRNLLALAKCTDNYHTAEFQSSRAFQSHGKFHSLVEQVPATRQLHEILEMKQPVKMNRTRREKKPADSTTVHVAGGKCSVLEMRLVA